MAISTALWSRRITAVLQDPHIWLAEGLTRSGLRQWFALMTVPLWLTPALYAKYLQGSSAGLSGKLTWAAASVWLGTMMLMGLPFTAMLQAPLVQVGKILGYWDDSFGPPLSGFLLMATSFVILLIIAGLEWALIWAAFGFDALIGSRTISPPAFGYVAIKVAGAMAGVAAITSGILFLIKPLNDPVWRWIDTAGLLQTLLIIGLGTTLMLGHNLKAQLTRSCGEQIYGSNAKAVIYKLCGPVIILAATWLFASL